MTPNGFTIYDGPSMLNGEPIIAIVTGFKTPSRNRKMGPAPLQTWILPRDIDPLRAIKTGADEAICGDCPHRGSTEYGHNSGRSCYVAVHQAPRNVWLAQQRGSYPERIAVLDLIALGYGCMIRLGTYGDPAAVPFWVWRALTREASWVMGYTHQWRDCHSELKTLCMASVDTPGEQARARALGWRTFRVRTADQDVAPHEVVCPASAEAGHRSTCEQCRACGGLNAKAKADIVIIVHGTAGKVGNWLRRQPYASS